MACDSSSTRGGVSYGKRAHDSRACDLDHSLRVSRRAAQGGEGVKKSEDVFAPEQLNELGADGWEAVGLSLKYGDLMAWPVVLLKRPVE